MPGETKLRKTYLGPSEVAELFMVSPATVRLWASKGELRAAATPGGHRRFLRQDIERFAREKNLSLHRRDAAATRILIVDDNEALTRFLTRQVLSVKPETEVVCVGDGYGAGRQVELFRPHVVLLDLMMPGLDGVEVCRQIKADPAHAATRVVAMTGYPSPENRERIIDAGAEACLAKPLDIDDLLAHLRLPHTSASAS